MIGFDSVFVGCHPSILEIKDLVAKIADTQASILISGESGTGKDQLVRHIHQLSSRARFPLIKVDCAALSPELLENELFGHERGAFTGARESKPGKLELGQHGTIHLDNVTSMSLPMQAKVTRVIQERYFERLGGSRRINLDIRFIATTVTDPALAVRQRMLRKDLFYRLNVVSIRIPPLRQRRSDIPLLVKHLLDRYNAQTERPVKSIDAEALHMLESFPWPGNVRQLENVLERAALTCRDGQIRVEDIRVKLIDAESELLDLAEHQEMTLAELERLYIERILRKTRGNNTRAARILGIHRKTLLEKRKRYGLP